MLYDVAIIGGGPAGSTAASLLKKYDPDLKVVVLERERFPRDHVGESQLPPISKVLDEMGCWDKVEAANFPIKIGATYRWGKSPELWDFEFLPSEKFIDEPRPAQYAGQRRWTAFQVDRAIYDDILLRHAESLGAEVREECRVLKVLRNGDMVEGLDLEDGGKVEARYYLDASGHAGILRRTMGVKADSPTTLQNIAIWDYWQNADWAIEIGVGGTRVQVMSLGYGWIWFIPLGPTRTSIGLVVPAEYYKTCGLKAADLYDKAIHEEPLIRSLIKNATREGKFETTKDWSFLADRHSGDNWFLIGESGGFADPILAAGLTLAQWSAREAAYTILELERGKHSSEWLKADYDIRQSRRITNHIRFADYWYTANSQFSDLQDFTQRLAADNGLELSPEKAWAWLAQGGFVDDSFAGIAGFGIEQVKAMNEFMTSYNSESVLAKTNVFKLDLKGANWSEKADYKNGAISKYGCYERGKKVLPLIGAFGMIVDFLERSPRLGDMLQRMGTIGRERMADQLFMNNFILAIPQTLEGMISDGWVEASYDPSQPLVAPPASVTGVRWNSDQRVQLGV